jgi:hypothetical protein
MKNNKNSGLAKLLGRLMGAAVICLSAQSVWAAPADDVKQLLESGKAADAYALAKEHPDQLGDPTFDFYFGVAAGETGHAGEAVLALERYILRFPDNVAARLQLARAYYLLGEDARAREEFESLRKLDPPADALATIDRFIESIRLRETRYKPSAAFYLEAGIGTDSNVNSGPLGANLILPNFGAILLDPAATRRSDEFTLLGAGGYASYPIAPGISLTGNAQLELKSNWAHENRQFDLGNYNFAGGLSFLKEKELFRIVATDGLITQGSDRYVNALGMQGEWAHQLDERQSFNVGLQTARLTYPGANQARNADFYGVNIGYRRLFAYAWQPILSLNVNQGTQRTRTDRPDLVPDTTGARAAVSFTPAARWGVSVGQTYVKSKYNGEDVFLGVTREDSFNATDLAVSYLVSSNLTVRAEYAYMRNRSNIELFSFPREIAAIKVRYEFK